MSKNYKQQVLKDVDIDIEAGEFISVMGPSGSGKSTLLYNVSGMDQTTSGSVRFNDIAIEKATDKELAELRLNRMGFVFQQNHLLKDLNIQDNILLPGFASGKFSREEVKKRGNMLIDDLGIRQVAENRTTEASGGQLQRVSIARALINEPDILFGDEPTGALNSSASMDVMKIFLDINKKGTTVMVVTHDARVAAMSDRVIFMSDGKLLSEISLGKYDEKEDLSHREQRLSTWLIKHGI
jgi:putative ABC transport system ATP-binding protein